LCELGNLYISFFGDKQSITQSQLENKKYLNPTQKQIFVKKKRLYYRV